MRKTLYILLLLAFIGCKQSEKTTEGSQINEMEKSDVNNRQDQWMTLQNKYAPKREAGMSFYAFGENPNWEISMDEKQKIHFSSQSEFGDYYASEIEGMEPQDINAMIYGAQTQEGSLSVMVFSESCKTEDGEMFPYRITVSGRKEEGRLAEFRGCGLYLNNPALHDIWAVKTWSALSANKVVDSGAYLEFNMKSQRLYGNLGCGEIEGNFTPMGDKIKIYGMDYLNEICDGKDTAKELFDLLNFKTHKLVIQEINLMLIHEQDTVKFIKAD